MLIGDLGGGKTTLACWFNEWIQQQYPDVPKIANTDFKSARKYEDPNKFIAIKLMKKDKQYAFVTTDEGAQAGFESRGSGTQKAALESIVISLARKAHVDWVIITQLMSMIDKRGQWLANFFILCEAIFEADNWTPFPDYFEYTVYNNNLDEIGGFTINFADAEKYLFPKMDTDDVPFAETLKAQWIKWYNITSQDESEFYDIMAPRAS